MSEPSVFISSTYTDLKIIREVIDVFIENLGYRAVRFEEGDISFNSDKELDQMCYDEVSISDIYILIIGNRYGALTETMTKDHEKKISITRAEYRYAVENKIKIYGFVDKELNVKYDQYKSGCLININKDDENLFSFIKEVRSQKGIFLRPYDKVHDICTWLQKQWAGLFKKYITNERKYELRKETERKINAYKLFFYRRNQGISINELSKRSGLSENKIRSLEKVTKQRGHNNDLNGFQSCKYHEAQSLADSLGCGLHNIIAGVADDFLSQFMLYYRRYKGKPVSKTRKESSIVTLFKTKVVVFDFDGTLTINKNNYTSWEEIWIKLGYSVNECAKYHEQYNNGIITHKRWCSITEKRFIQRKLHKSHLDEIAKNIELINGVEILLKALDSKGIQIYLISGSIDYIIKNVLKEYISYFVDVRSNVMRFDDKGYLREIIGTQYDFEGKADYIKQLTKNNEIDPLEVVYIGNSVNDTFVHESGATTICVNPRLTDPDSRMEWDQAIRYTTNINEVLRYINI